MSEGTVRVKKAATEFNISVQHLVEHLASKGFSVESNPNAKITDEMYQALLRDFGQDKKIKEQAAQIHIGKAGKEDLVLDQKSVSQSPKSRAEQKEVLIKGMGTNTATTPAKAKKAEAELPKAPKTEAVVPEPEKTPDHTPTPEPVVEAKAEPVTGLKVVGKIDLSTEATKGPKKSKKKSDSSEAEATTPAR